MMRNEIGGTVYDGDGYHQDQVKKYEEQDAR